jgi:hypothetical protein
LVKINCIILFIENNLSRKCVRRPRKSVGAIVEQSNNDQSFVDIEQYITVGDVHDRPLGVEKTTSKKQSAGKKSGKKGKLGRNEKVVTRSSK